MTRWESKCLALVRKAFNEEASMTDGPNRELFRNLRRSLQSCLYWAQEHARAIAPTKNREADE
jgi:hypothetical protein